MEINQPAQLAQFEKTKPRFEKYCREMNLVCEHILARIPAWKTAVEKNSNSVVVIDIDGTFFMDYPGNYRVDDKGLFVPLPAIPPFK